jgi:hypothetical protein
MQQCSQCQYGDSQCQYGDECKFAFSVGVSLRQPFCGVALISIKAAAHPSLAPAAVQHAVGAAGLLMQHHMV